MSQGIHLVSNNIPGYIHPDGKFKPSSDHMLLGGTNVVLKTFPIYHTRTVSIKCKQSNNHRRNPDFSRHLKGSPQGKNLHHHQENSDDSDPLPSKNGSLPSLPSSQRYSTPGRREKEIVDLFRKVQAQLRERASIKEEKKVESSQQRQQGGDRGTVDSLLKLLRKHSVAQSNKKSDGEEEFILDEEEPSNITTCGRPASNFKRRSPVPRVKFQPVFSSCMESEGKTEFEESGGELLGVSGTDVGDIASLKLSELKELAKSRGLKGYSKLKKGELVELLNGDCS